MASAASGIPITFSCLCGGRDYDVQVSIATHSGEGNMLILPQALSFYEEVCRPPHIAWNTEQETFQAEEDRWSTTEDIAGL